MRLRHREEGSDCLASDSGKRPPAAPEADGKKGAIDAVRLFLKNAGVER